MTTMYFSKNKPNYETITFSTTTKKNNETDYVTELLNKAYNILLPWYKNDTKDTKDTKKNNKYNTINLSSDILSTYFFTSITSAALNLEWNKAASRLADYIYYTENPTYDFMIEDIPVKIHGNYIQIGSELIPKFTNIKFFDKYDNETKKQLYIVALIINNF